MITATAKKKMGIMLALLMVVLPGSGGAAEVNNFIGTGGSGFGVGSTFPGPCLPFGMARPGPDTARLGVSLSFYHCGGYYYSDGQVRGFSQFRLSGIGAVDYGNVLVMPTLNRSGHYDDESSYRQRFEHKSEQADPGYYAVTLESSGIRAELTATEHCGLHRFTFPTAGRGRIIINAAHANAKDGVCAAEVEVAPVSREVTGRAVSCGSLSGRNGGVEIFFAARLSRPILTSGFSQDGAVAWVEVETGPDDPALVAVGLSFISVEQARRHLDGEVKGKSFDLVRADAELKWARALKLIEISGGTPDQRAIFYTALYHSEIMPTDFTESGGLYRGFDEKVHEARGFTYYTDFSLWDTFRTLHPLLTLLLPERSGDMMQSLTLMAEQGGYLPRWPTGYRYTSCMIGQNADNVIADAYVKGVRNFDAAAAYAAMRQAATEPMPPGRGYPELDGLAEYMSQGYVPADRYGGAASWTIELSYNDFAIAQMARALGHDEDHDTFMARSGNWRNIWDAKSGYLRGRKADGAFKWPFAAWAWTSYYVEGDARQWVWAPLHDAHGLIELMGGPEKFAQRLNGFFEKSAERPDTFLWDTYYWHGNEPDIHAAYLFDYAGRPDLTQKWARWVMAAKYKNAPGGLDGNDDCGTLSAWYVFSALGFYPVAATDTYLVGSPLFPRAVLHLPGGDLTVRAVNDPAKNIYVRRVSINGRPLERPWFRHDDIAHGGEIVFEMSAEPGAWNAPAAAPVAAPPTAAGDAAFIDWAHLKNPVLSLEDRAVKDQVVVYDNGWFYIFASNRFENNDDDTFLEGIRFYRTRDFKTYEPFFDPDLITYYQGRPGFPESPDVVNVNGVWHMVFQSRLTDHEHYRLFHSVSHDLMDWSPAVEIAPGNKPKERQIDGALAYEGGHFILGYKGRQKFYVTRSLGPELDGAWEAARRASAGGKWAENFQFIRIDGAWRMIATAINPKVLKRCGYTCGHEAYIYEMDGKGGQDDDWTRWTDMRRLEVPTEDWNRVMIDNSAYLCDWRQFDGWFYLFYAGCNDDGRFQKQGHGQIGVARSRDLITWRLPGQMDD
ncbi:MAG TPA: GH92 family glycosyl hydrolase [bacterium]|nr:GH92 family glycosyl hydrolase [bacterium]